MVIKKITTETCEDLLVNLKNLNNAELKPYFEFEKEVYFLHLKKYLPI